MNPDSIVLPHRQIFEMIFAMRANSLFQLGLHGDIGTAPPTPPKVGKKATFSLSPPGSPPEAPGGAEGLGGDASGGEEDLTEEQIEALMPQYSPYIVVDHKHGQRPQSSPDTSPEKDEEGAKGPKDHTQLEYNYANS